MMMSLRNGTGRIRRVRARGTYTYRPVMMDRAEPPWGVAHGTLTEGQVVRVVNLPGCPRANTMGHCHIENLAGVFVGMVCCNSLEPAGKGAA